MKQCFTPRCQSSSHYEPQEEGGRGQNQGGRREGRRRAKERKGQKTEQGVVDEGGSGGGSMALPNIIILSLIISKIVSNSRNY